MRPEVGFNPSWFHEYCKVDLSQKWHEDPEYRLQCFEVMSQEIRRRFPGRPIGGVELFDEPLDLLTGVYGAVPVAAMFGMQLLYFPDKWPVAVGEPLSDEEMDALTAVDLENNAFFQGILEQIDEIEKLTGAAKGFLNWQGVLNTAFRLRGQQIFIDMLEAPHRAHHLFDCVAETMISGIKLLHQRQREGGTVYHFATIGNCVVNMISPTHYEEQLLPFDLKIRAEFRDFGIHNCAWNVNPYMDAYTKVADLGYLDMGISSNLARVRELFPGTRRNVLYTSMDLVNKSEDLIRSDLEMIAEQLAPCDVGFPDLEVDVPDERIVFALDLCTELSAA
jgi:hypothetical protein